eukprot:m.270728 g.270728  ORF g.270728 m.270728 type:complete len:4196 (-) comp17668_c0_seq1:27-12614(-)
MSFNLTFWDAKQASLCNAFWDANQLQRLWLRLCKDKVMKPNPSRSRHLENNLSDELVRWADLTAEQLQSLLLEEQAYRNGAFGRTPFEDRAECRHHLLEQFYKDLAAFAVGVYLVDGGSTHPTARPSACVSRRDSRQASPARSRANSNSRSKRMSTTVALPSAEDRFKHLATRAVVNMVFSFMRQATNAGGSMVQELMMDAAELMDSLPMASLQKQCNDDPNGNWTFALKRTQTFLADLSLTAGENTVETRTQAHMLSLELAAQTGNIVHMLLAICHLLAASEELLRLPCASYLMRLDELRQLHVPVIETHVSSTSDIVNVIDVLDEYLESTPSVSQSTGMVDVASGILTQLARLSPPDRTEFEDVKVFSWGNTRDGELGHMSSRVEEAPMHNTILSKLNPTHIALGFQCTFVIDGEGRLWSCGVATKEPNVIRKLLGHADPGLALVEGVEHLRFSQVAVTHHVLALAVTGEVYSWGADSYHQLGREGDCSKPLKVTALDTEEVVHIAAGGHHSAAVSKSGKLFTWGRGGYGRLGHGNSDDVAAPTRVTSLPDNESVVHAACGLGDAHSLCVTKEGNIYSFGDGDFGKLGHGNNDRHRKPERIQFGFDGSGVKMAWCGLQTSACLTNHGALYTWGYASSGALGNGETTGGVANPIHILEDHVITSVAFGHTCGLALTAENDVFFFGQFHNSMQACATPVLLPKLVGKNITQLAVGSQHVMAWTGSVSASPGVSVPFAPKGEAAVLEAILQTFDRLKAHPPSVEANERCTFSLLSLLERSFQLCVRSRVDVPPKVITNLRTTLLEFASASLSISSRIATAAQFCLLQGWPMLHVEEEDRQRLLQSVTDVVLVNGVANVPDDKDINLAKELIRSRWRFLMPVPDRLQMLADLLPRTRQFVCANDTSPLDRQRADGHDFVVTQVIDSLIRVGVPERCLLSLCGSQLAASEGVPYEQPVSADLAEPSFADAFQAEPANDLNYLPPVTGSVLKLIRHAVDEWTQIAIHTIQSKKDMVPCRTLSRLVLQFQRVLFALVFQTDEPEGREIDWTRLDISVYLNFILKRSLEVLNAFQQQYADLDFVNRAQPAQKALQQLATIFSSLPLMPLSEAFTSLLGMTNTPKLATLSGQILTNCGYSMNELVTLVSKLTENETRLREANMVLEAPSPDQATAAEDVTMQALLDLGQACAMAIGTCARSAFLEVPSVATEEQAKMASFLINPVFSGGLVETIEDEEVPSLLIDLVQMKETPATASAVQVISLYLIEHHRLPAMAGNHPSWKALGALLAVLIHHLQLEPEFEEAMSQGNLNSPKLQEALKAVAALQSHLLQLKQQHLISYEVLLERLSKVGVFLTTELAPANTVDGEDHANRDEQWQSSRVRIVSVNNTAAMETLRTSSAEKASTSDGDSVESPVNTTLDRAESELDTLMVEDDWHELVHTATQSWLTSRADGKFGIATMPKQITELTLAYLTEPFDLAKARARLHAQSELAARRLSVLRRLSACLELAWHGNAIFALLCGFQGDLQLLADKPSLGLIFAGVENTSSKIRLELRRAYVKICTRVAKLLQGAAQRLCEPAVVDKDCQLRLLHALVSVLFQRHEAATLDVLLRSSLFVDMHKIQEQLLSLARVELAQIDSTPEPTQQVEEEVAALASAADSAAASGQSGLVSLPVPNAEAAPDADDLVTEPDNNDEKADSEADMPSSPGIEANAWDALPVTDGIETLEVSSRVEGAANMLTADTETSWTSSGRRGEHWILIKLKAHICIRALKIYATGVDSFAPKLVEVFVGQRSDELQRVASVDCPAIRSGPEIVLLENVKQHYAYVKITISASGINTRIARIVVDGYDMSALQNQLTGHSGHHLAVGRLLNFLALSGAMSSNELSDASLDELCGHCRIVVEEGNANSQATFLSLFRRLMSSVRLQQRFSSTSWTDLLLSMFTKGTPQVRILTMRFMKEVLPGLKSEVDIQSLTQKMMRQAALLLTAGSVQDDISGVGDEVVSLLRGLYSLENWQPCLDRHVHDKIALLPFVRQTMTRQTPLDQDLLKDVSATLTILGSQRAGLRVGADGTHALYGPVTVVQVDSDQNATIYCPEDEKSKGTRHLVTLNKTEAAELKLRALQEFDYAAMVRKAGGVQTCALMLAESLEDWPKEVEGATLQHRLLQACAGLLDHADALSQIMLSHSSSHAQEDDKEDKIEHDLAAKVLREAVKPSPLRARYELQALTRATDKLLRSVQTGGNIQADTAELKLLNFDAVQQIKVSSNERRAESLRTEGDSAWQSNGRAGAHWIELIMKPEAVLKELYICHSSEDGSYQPSRIVVSGGQHGAELQEIAVIEIPSTETRTALLTNNTKPLTAVRLAIKRCQQGGCDTKIRGLEVVAHRSEQASPTASMSTVFAEDVGLVQHGELSLLQAHPELSRSASMATLTTAGLGEIDDTTPSNPVFYCGSNPQGLYNGLFNREDVALNAEYTQRFVVMPRLAELHLRKLCLTKNGLFVLTVNGQLLETRQGTALTPVAFSGPVRPVIIDIAASRHHILALSENRHVFSHGTNAQGQLGLGHAQNVSEFVSIPGLDNVTGVACGKTHSAVWFESGELYMFGCGHYGRLGLGDEADHATPMRVDAIGNVIHVACGDRHTLAVTKDGSVYAWGYAEHGRCGVSTPRRKLKVPLKVPHLPANVVKVFAGPTTSAALSASGALYVWGSGRNYRLGTNTEGYIWRPRTHPELNLLRVTDCSLALNHGVAVTERGTAFLWGSNEKGALGDMHDVRIIMAPSAARVEDAKFNRVSCSSIGTILYSDPSGSSAFPLPARAGEVLSFTRPIDRLGDTFEDKLDLSDLGPRPAATEGLVPLLAQLVTFPQRTEVLSKLLHASRIAIARQLALVWLSRGPTVVDSLRWSPSRSLLVLVDFVKLMAARLTTTADTLRPAVDAMMHLLEKHNELVPAVSMLITAEVGKTLPNTDEEALHFDSDLLLLSSVCSLGLVHAVVTALPGHAKPETCMELVVALATLWLRHPRQAVRHWCLLRLIQLISTGGVDLLRQVQSLFLRQNSLPTAPQEQQEASPPYWKSGGNPSRSDSEEEEDQDDLSGGSPTRRNGSSRSAESADEILPMALFKSCRTTSQEDLNVLEMALLLARVGLNSSAWALDKLRSGLVEDEQEKYSHKLADVILDRGGLSADSHHKPLVDTADNGATVAMNEFTESLWETLQSRLAFEEPIIKRADQLVHSSYVRALVRVNATLGLGLDSLEDSHWYNQYRLMARVVHSWMSRAAFPEQFLQAMQSALGSNEADANENGSKFDPLQNSQFSREMDMDLLEWKRNSPEDLKLTLHGRQPCVQLISPVFSRISAGDELDHLEFSNNNVTVAMKSDTNEQNTWIVGDPILTSGVHYWAVRCDIKGSSRRYVGVGVGRNNSPFPVGAARLLSDGHLKSAAVTLDIPEGFKADDMVGVLLDLDGQTVSFDVNGQKRGEIGLPDTAPGDGIRPLIYLFSPKDRFSFVHDIPVPHCYESQAQPKAFYVSCTSKNIPIYSLPNSAHTVSSLVGSGPGEEPVYCVQVHEATSTAGGVWIRLANADKKWGQGQCWCLLRDSDCNANFKMITAEAAERLSIINATDELPSDLMTSTPASPERPAGAKIATCTTPASGHLIRAAASLEALEMGTLKPQEVVYYTHIISSDDGDWLVLHEETKRRLVDSQMLHLDAFSLYKTAAGTAYFQLKDEEPAKQTSAPSNYAHLQGIAVSCLKRRSFVLDNISNRLLPLLPVLELSDISSQNLQLPFGLGGTNESLKGMQTLISFSHKERMLKSIVQRTNSTTNRVTITLNRVSIKLTSDGLAGPEGRNSVFAQAARELRAVDPSVLLLPARQWKVRFTGEGLDDAGGGFSESISEMCEELHSRTVPLLIKTPNALDDAGDNRDVYLLDPTANSSYHLELFEFLGILMGIAIRTASPIELRLAPCVWRQISGLRLTIGDIKEVATNFVSTLEFIRGLAPQEELFSSWEFPTTTPSAKEGVTYEVVPGARLTTESRGEYVRKALHYRLHEFDDQIQAIRRGLAKVVPLPVLSLFTAPQLEALVVGYPTFDLVLLRAITKYKGCNSSCKQVNWFWQAMANLTPEEHSLFLRFVWGRTRMPRSEADFGGNNFKLQLVDKHADGSKQADASLPEALTCFFLLKLPQYSSAEILEAKLRYAITNCKAIDSDSYARTSLPEE